MTWRDKPDSGEKGKFRMTTDFFKPKRIPNLKQKSCYRTTLKFNSRSRPVAGKQSHSRLGFGIQPVLDDVGEQKDFGAYLSTFDNDSLSYLIESGSHLLQLDGKNLKNMNTQSIVYNLRSVKLPCQVTFRSQHLAPVAQKYFDFKQSVVNAWEEGPKEKEKEEQNNSGELTKEVLEQQDKEEAPVKEDSDEEPNEFAEEDKVDPVRLEWTVGSVVEVKSQTLGMWLKGTICVIEHDDDGEWLSVRYETPDGRSWKKETARDLVNEIRPYEAPEDVKPEEEESESSDDEKEERKTIPTNFDEAMKLLDQKSEPVDDLDEDLALIEELKKNFENDI